MPIKKETLSPEDFEEELTRVSSKRQLADHELLIASGWQCFYISYVEDGTYNRAALCYVIKPNPTQLDPKPRNLYIRLMPNGFKERYTPGRKK